MFYHNNSINYNTLFYNIKLEKMRKILKIDGNLKGFTEEFIGAGPRTSVIGLYNSLVELGAIPNDRHKDSILISSKKPIVLLCVNDGVNSVFARVSVHEKTWWDFYHNKKKSRYKVLYKTYNACKQLINISKLLVIKPKELLIPE